MCGIFGYLGNKENSTEMVVEGLKRLEYRGYDSWGLASILQEKPAIDIVKKVGKISDFKETQFQKSHIAIGHSRWATHGGVTHVNAHPHASEKEGIAVVHNGIIENYQELREELAKEGHKFKSETDTEVIPHLIERYIEFGFEKAFQKALARLKGRFAIVVIGEKQETIMAARRGSPMIVGKGKNEYFVASDIPAFLPYTRDVMYIDDNEMLIIKKNGKKADIQFFNLQDNSPVEKRIVEIEWDYADAEKGDFDHFMLKEIMDQKETINRAINQDSKEILKVAERIKSAYGTFLVGCGTAGKVCMAGDYFLSKIAKKHVNFVVGSEFAAYHHFLTDKTLMMVVSQSGETADVLEAMEVAKEKGVQILSLVNVEGSSIQRQSDYSFLINAGPEKAVASTKAATSQLSLLLMIAYAVAGKLEEGRKLLIESASKINDMLNPRYLTYIKAVAEKIYKQENMYIIGKGENYPMALESAIKIQEVSYIHAEGFAAGELKHGPIALIEGGVPCLVLLSKDENYQDVINNAVELKSRGGYIIGISPENNEIFDQWIKVPDVNEASPIVNIIPVQILAYYFAVLRGKNPDMPRNLAKSVTVK